MKKPFPKLTVALDAIVNGGQAIGTLEDGRRAFVWGGLPGETVEFQVSKKKSKYVEGVVTEILADKSSERIEPLDIDSYLSTSPWQIMTPDAEQKYKKQLIKESFDLHKVALDTDVALYTDGIRTHYRNKIEFSFWFDTDTEKLSFAFFRRGTHGKIAVEGTSLASEAITAKSQQIIAVLNEQGIEGRSLKTLLIRSDLHGNTAWQLYVKDEDFSAEEVMARFAAGENGEIIFSNPKSPASVITKKLTSGGTPLTDTIRSVPFRYATEGFFQINLPVYERALSDMAAWVPEDKPVLDLYSGVGSIGLTIGGAGVTLIEVNESAVREMRQNIQDLGIEAEAILSASENVLEYITSDKTIIVDPPRAGLHQDVVDRLLDQKPERIIYLSCNPVTQARDVALLQDSYRIVAQQGYNFFPMTPHIENLMVLDLNANI